MNLQTVFQPLVFRSVCLALALGVSACSGGGGDSDGSVGGLLNNTGGSGSGSGSTVGAGATLQVQGPSGQGSGTMNVRVGSQTANFKVILRNSRGQLVADRFVKLAVTAPTANGGSISGTVKGGQNEGGTQTGTNGVGIFSYIAPTTVPAAGRRVTITATFDESETDTIDPVIVNYSLNVTPQPQGVLSFTHAGSTQTVQLDSGITDDDFLVELVTEGDLEPIVNQEVKFILTNCNTGTGATINAPSDAPGSTTANTNEGGFIGVGFTTPGGLSAATTCTITAETTVNAVKKTAKLNVLVNKSPGPVVRIASGPQVLKNEQVSQDFVVRVTPDNGGSFSEPPCVTLTTAFAPTGGSVVITPQAGTLRCNNAAAGNSFVVRGSALNFTVRPTVAGTAEKTLTLTATSTVNGQTSTDSFAATIAADTFKFLDPEENEALRVGIEAGRGSPVNFQWTNPDGTPFVGDGTLTTDKADSYFTVNGQELNQGAAALVTFTEASGGNFLQVIGIKSNSPGQAKLTLTATSKGGIQRTESVLVQFVKLTPASAVASLRLTVDTPVVQCSPNANRFTNLTVVAENSEGQPAASVDIDFSVRTAADVDNVFPTTQTTSDEGVATTNFEAGGVPHKLTVIARVRNNSSIVSERPILIVDPTDVEAGEDPPADAQACLTK